MKTKLLITSFALMIASYSCLNPNGGWKNLLNGTDLKNWKIAGDPEGFKVEDGVLVCETSSSTIYYKNSNFRNFELESEVLTQSGTRAGLFFHTSFRETGYPSKGYEISLGNGFIGSGGEGERLKTGSISGVRNIYFPFVADNEWFRLKLKVVENHIEVYVNDTKINDYIQPQNPWRNEASAGKLVSRGTFALCSYENGGKFMIRNLKIMKLPKDKMTAPEVNKDWDTVVTKLMDEGFPLIDFHVHLKGGLTIEQAVENSQKSGINYGIAPNCGLHFPVTNDSSLFAYMQGVSGKPIFKGMQAEGREWITLFSPKAISEFDYVFTDAMTFTDSKGRRNRIWIPEEVWVDDKEEFMDQMVGKIEAIFSQEPVDIYVNPTVLPAVLMEEYDQLWTKERMERVIRILADNNIALEINARYKVPRPEMIKMAKAAGIKFSFGTNNTGNELGHLEYCLEMIDQCGLKPGDIFEPKADKDKPVNVKGLPAKITG